MRSLFGVVLVSLMHVLLALDNVRAQSTETSVCSNSIVGVDGAEVGCVAAESRNLPFELTDLTRPSLSLDRERFYTEDSTGQALAMIEPVRLPHLFERRVELTGADGVAFSTEMPFEIHGNYAIEYRPHLLTPQHYELTLQEQAIRPNAGNRENLLQSPFDGTRGAWQQLVTPDVMLAQNGDIKITDNNSGAHEGLSQSVDIGSGENGVERFVTAQISVPKAIDLPVSSPGLWLEIDSRRSLLGINTVDGTAEPFHSVHIPYDWGVIDDGDYWTVWVTARTESPVSTATLEVFAATRTVSDNWTWTAESAGTMAFRNPVVYVGQFSGNAIAPNLLSAYDDIERWSALVTPTVEQFRDGRFTITDNNTGTHEGVFQSVALSTTQSHVTAQVRIAKAQDNSPPVAFPGLWVEVAGKHNRVAINTVTGELSHDHGTSQPDDYGVVDEGSYWRVWLTAVADGASVATFQLFPSVVLNETPFSWSWSSLANATTTMRDPSLREGLDITSADVHWNLLAFTEDVRQEEWGEQVPGYVHNGIVTQFDDGSFQLESVNDGAAEGICQKLPADPGMRLGVSARVRTPIEGWPYIVVREPGVRSTSIVVDGATRQARPLHGTQQALDWGTFDEGEYLRVWFVMDAPASDAFLCLESNRFPGTLVGTNTFRDPQVEHLPANFSPASYADQINHYQQRGPRYDWLREISGGFDVVALSEVTPFPGEGDESGDGIEITLSDLDYGNRWPVRLGVPLSNWDENPVFELRDQSGRLIPLGQKIVSRWDRRGNAKWVHLDFVGRWRGEGNQTLTLRKGQATGSTDLNVNDGATSITVDTGQTSFVVDKAAFAVNGKGPFIFDELGNTYAPGLSGTVVVEDQTATSVTILAVGEYEDGNGNTFHSYRTRINAYADSPGIFVEHQTILTDDPHSNRIADLGWSIPAVQASRDERAIVGIDDRRVRFRSDGWAHQYRHDRVRIRKPNRIRNTIGADEVPLVKLDGWAQLGSSAVVLRHAQKKFPKEFSWGDGELRVHFWPRHGCVSLATLQDSVDGTGWPEFTDSACRLAYDEATEELPPEHIYKFRSFVEGKLMDLQLPQSYIDQYDEFVAAGAVPDNVFWRSEAGRERETSIDANAQGVAIANEMVILLDADNLAKHGANVKRFARNFEKGVVAAVDPQWIEKSAVFGGLGARVNGEWDDYERLTEDLMLEWGRRGQKHAGEYGMWNFGDVHGNWFVDLVPPRPSLHRSWQGSHYFNVSTAWLMAARSGFVRPGSAGVAGSEELYRWAQEYTGHYINIDTNHVDVTSPGLARAGAMQHVGWRQHWAISGFSRQLLEHYADPEASLYSWYLTGNRRARDVYNLWLQSAMNYRQRLASFQCSREQNPAMSHLVTAYQYSHDPALLPTIRHLGDNCMMGVDIAVQTGLQGLLLWHPLWTTRFHEQTRVPHDVARFIALGQTLKSSWRYTDSTMALAALAYDLGGDATLLATTRSGESFPCDLHARHARYSLLGDFWVDPSAGLNGGLPHRAGSQSDMAWPYWLAASRRAGITDQCQP